MVVQTLGKGEKGVTITRVWIIILIAIACVSDFASITFSGHGGWQEGWAWISAICLLIALCISLK